MPRAAQLNEATPASSYQKSSPLPCDSERASPTAISPIVSTGGSRAQWGGCAGVVTSPFVHGALVRQLQYNDQDFICSLVTYTINCLRLVWIAISSAHDCNQRDCRTVVPSFSLGRGRILKLELSPNIKCLNTETSKLTGLNKTLFLFYFTAIGSLCEISYTT